MKLPRLRTLLLVPVLFFVLLYVGIAIVVALDARSIEALDAPAANADTIVIFGASGTAGDGILAAALDDPGVDTIHVITRRSTPRIAAGAEAGKVQVTVHTDYLDYSSLHPLLADADAVFWAIGTSSIGVDEETYARIHVDFPATFVEAWLLLGDRPGASFHYISSSDISAESTAMWAREKFRAEQTLTALASDTGLDVIAYRPDYIGPTPETTHLGQELLYGFFAPVGAAVRARQIGEAMLEVTARGEQFDNGDTVGTYSIRRLSDAYRRRVGARAQP